MKPRLLICGNYGASNLGDEALLDGLLHALRELSADSEISILSAQPQVTSVFQPDNATYQLLPSGPRSLLRGGIRATLKAIKEADFFILGGGGLFSDERPRAILIWALQALAALSAQKPLLCLGQSVGPLSTAFGRRITSAIMKKARSILVRDHASAQVLQHLGIENVHRAHDFAFSLPPLPAHSKREPFIVLSIRPWPQSGARNMANYQSLARLIDWIFEHKKLKTLLVPFQALEPGDHDEVPLRAVYHELRHPEAAEFIPFQPDYRATLRLVGKAQAVIGMRLHSLIFATLTHTPFLALSYSQKVDAFVREVEMEEYLFSWNEMSVGGLIGAFEKLEHERAHIIRKLEHKRKYFHQKNLEALRAVMDFS